MNGQSDKQARIDYIDLFRAFGIIVMIMGHIRFGSYFDKWIHAFHMPMFFFVSGWFYKSNYYGSVWEQILKKVRSLLLPYIIFEIGQWLILLPFIPEYRNIIIIKYIFTENTFKVPVESDTFGISPIPGAMWFLTAIFIAEVIYNLLDRFLKGSWESHFVVVVIVAFGMLAPSILPFRLPWALDAAFVGVGFFHIAKITRGTKVEKILNIKLWQAIILAIVFGVLIMLCPKINMRTGNYGWYFSFWLNALGAIVVGWNISRFVDTILDKHVRTIGLWMKGIGKNSIVYLCFNQIVILGVMKLLSMLDVNKILIKFLVLIFTLVILFGFEKLICTTKIKVLVGK